MSTTAELIASKQNEKYTEELVASLKKQKKGLGGFLGNFIKSKNSLSDKNVEIGLLLLNEMPAYADEKSWYRTYVAQDSKRFLALKERSDLGDFWNAKTFPLLEFIFGAENAPFVKNAWDKFPTLMYQTGYARRSFRGTGLDAIYFTRQINFLIDLIHENNYNFSLGEYAIHSNTISAGSFSFVYAAAIDSNQVAFRQQCIDAILGNHATARPSRDVIKAMLLSNDPECWTAIEKLLLSPQRQEGLRQSILECLDETSLGAMKHMIKVVIEHKLARFSSVVRAIDTWAGFGWEAEKETTVRRFLELADRFLSDPSQIEQGVQSLDNGEVYMALWAQGVLDVSKCEPLLEKVLSGGHEKITLALYFISQVGLSTYSIKYGKRYLDYDDPVVICQAAEMVNDEGFLKMMSKSEKETVFVQLEKRLDMFPKKTALSKPKVFSWLTFNYGKERVLDLMINLLDLEKEGDIDKIVPYFDSLALNHREKVTRQILPGFGYSFRSEEIKRAATLTKRKRDFAFSIIKDRSETVRSTAIKALSASALSGSEVQVFEGLLTRKAADFRRSTLELIIKHGEDQVQESAERLIAEKTEDQRLAGLDLLLWLNTNSPKHRNWVASAAKEFSERPKISSKEEVVLKGLLQEEKNQIEYTSTNGFGLFDPTKVPEKTRLKQPINELYSKSTSVNKYGLSMPEDKVNSALKNLSNLFLKHKEYEYTHEDWGNTQTTSLLGNTFARLKYDTKGMTPEEKFCNCPLHETWRTWFNESGLTNRDLLLINLYARPGYDFKNYKGFESLFKKVIARIYVAQVPKITNYEWQNPIYNILEVLAERYPYEGAIDYLAGLNHELFDAIDRSTVSSHVKNSDRWNEQNTTWRDQAIFTISWTKYHSYVKEMSKEQFQSYWDLVHWKYLTVPKNVEFHNNYLPDVYDYARAFKDGLIDTDTLYWRVLHRDAINLLTRPTTGEQYDVRKEFDFLNPILDKCRDRILEVELIRGDSSTSVTVLAQNINRLYGITNFVELLKALGKDPLNRGYIYVWGNHEYNKKQVLSTLLKNCYPPKHCTQEAFNSAVKAAGITEKRLCDCSTYAPQWLPFVAEYLGWKDMESAVWWLHAHTNGHHDTQTESETAKYSSVDITAFKDGAVDIDWFKETYKSLGAEKWKKLYDAAKYISDGGGHKRGLLYADVILGKTKIKEITERITSKRNQDFLRVYGVIPLSKANPKKDVLQRYQFLQNFKKESKQHGSQRQASEAIAVRIALENLARTAGYPDPIRLQWAMETKEAQDIIANSQNIQFGDTKLLLEIDAHGKSSIVAIKDDKRLKTIPAKLKKEKELIKLKAYNKTLREQYRRTRKSLENAMINGDVFSKEEMETLAVHPVVAPMMKKLVLISENNLGFWNDGKLITAEGNELESGEEIRIAHCVDLFEAKKWSSYQKHCFGTKLVQPFKQIFRELYIPTEDELKEKSISRRYAGHQVQPRKTVALLKGQSWTVDYESGLQKVLHKQNTIARMFAMADWFSPADVESPTLETVEFFNRKDGNRLSFEDVDKRIFSETMRDIDLVVSVAHVGEVDPEASQSSIELRAVIIEETCLLFKLKNVVLDKNHAKIKGGLGDYTVHLGSGVCHKVAGSSLSIIPVHSQHRGRMFLPFVDDDPKTAEIISKILLLAKDTEIKDPTVLRQL